MTAKQAVPDQPRRGVLYLRQSTEKEETISDAIQRTAGLDYCARNGIELIRMSDPNFPSLEHGELWEQQSGRIWHKRNGVLRAMSLIESAHIDVIVLWKWSRLSRKRLHWVLAEEKVHQLGGSIESATEPADLTTSTGRFTRNMLVDMAELQSDQIGESWKETHANRRSRGLPASGGRRYGYQWVRDPDERYEVDEPEADVLRWVVNEYLDGSGWPSIVRELNQRDIPNAHGRPWRVNTLREILDGGFPFGLLHRTPQLRDSQSSAYRPLSERQFEPGAHVPILDEAMWRRYHAARLDRPQTPPRSINPAHPLTGLVRCGDCDGAMVRRPHPKTVQFYCQRWTSTQTGRCVTVAESRVHKEVLRWLRGLAAEVDTEAAATRLEPAKARAQTDMEQIAKQINELDQQLAELTKQLVAGVVQQRAYETVNADLTQQRAELEHRLARAEAETYRQTQQAEQVAIELLENWDVMPTQRKRMLLSGLIQSVTIYPPQIYRGRSSVSITASWEQ